MKRCSTFIFNCTILLAVVWLLGQFVSDRWLWSQWLLWIPAFAFIAFLFLATIALILSRDKQKSIFLGSIFLLCTAWFLFVENRVFSITTKHGDLRIVGWTMSHAKKNVASLSAKIIVQLDADITLLTHGWHVRGEPAIKEWREGKTKRLISGPFTLLTTLRPIEVKVLVASAGIYISLYRLDTTEQLGKELVMYAVDLPVNLKESRGEVVRRAKKLLLQADAPAPDIVVGDFNMTRNSNSLQRFFPELTDAWDDVGIGWSYSYHRAFPLFHIDHMLLRDTLHPVTYELINPEFGRHCIQVLELNSENFVNHVQITSASLKWNEWELGTDTNIVFPLH